MLVNRQELISWVAKKYGVNAVEASNVIATVLCPVKTCSKLRYNLEDCLQILNDFDDKFYRVEGIIEGLQKGL